MKRVPVKFTVLSALLVAVLSGAVSDRAQGAPSSPTLDKLSATMDGGQSLDQMYTGGDIRKDFEVTNGGGPGPGAGPGQHPHQPPQMQHHPQQGHHHKAPPPPAPPPPAPSSGLSGYKEIITFSVCLGLVVLFLL